jgi:hypothetical protein
MSFDPDLQLVISIPVGNPQVNVLFRLDSLNSDIYIGNGYNPLVSNTYVTQHTAAQNLYSNPDYVPVPVSGVISWETIKFGPLPALGQEFLYNSTVRSGKEGGPPLLT